ncbi:MULTISPECIES: S66 peptidase family protein [unclassified Sedimentibacter]|uniref:S66 peptidase family protein n=1 Tax=unclassified Sedimentibacter TaxID=2649220 RepID=UPI0027E148C7|nr:LD-carboxypeptidase [Sedimentibacter sp. MB35-C1]WMJ76785.1 LD-carboxypeptidase [Sedimentibacter sp. MB35-C1]
MIFPEKLKKGDKVAIVAPSSPVTQQEADHSRKFLENMGYKVRMGRSTYKSLHGYKAGTGEERARDINEMFSDKEVKAIFCIRGGDTSSHVIDKIDLNIVKNNPKIFVGYSDVTNLNVYFNQKADMVTFHGPMVKSNMINDFDDFSRESFKNAINMGDELYLKNPEGQDFRVICDGTAEGTIVGGNLSLLTSMIGTPYEIDTKDKVLFFEDIHENITKVDRMLYQLKFSNKINDAAAIIIGDFLECKNHRDPSYGIDDLMKEFFEGLSKPVMYNIKCGHCIPTSTIPLGTMCEVDSLNKTIKFKK